MMSETETLEERRWSAGGLRVIGQDAREEERSRESQREEFEL
jgi:hypothetical protein